MSVSKSANWTSHFAFTNCLAVEETDTHWVGATISGLIMVAKTDYSISTLTKTNGLSDFNITSIKGENKLLFIGYENGNIDIINNGKILNFNELKLKQGLGKKTINNFFVENSTLYCSTDFGIVVLDLNREEFKTTYYIGDNASALKVNKILTDDFYIYAATENGIYKSRKDAPDIHVYTSWSVASKTNDNYKDLYLFGDDILASKEIVEYDSNNEKITASYIGFELINSEESVSIPTSKAHQYFTVSDTLIYIIENKRILVLDNNFSQVSVIADAKIKNVAASTKFNDLIINDDKLIVADGNNGILIYKSNNWVKFLPDGPQDNLVKQIKFAKEKLWVVPGGIRTDWLHESRPAAASILTSKGWVHLTRANSFGNVARDMVGIAYNKKYPDNLYLHSYSSGVYEMDFVGDEIFVKNHFFEVDGGIQNIYATGSQFVRVPTGYVDNNGVLWIFNSQVQYPIVAYDFRNENWFQYNYGAISDLGRFDNLIVLSNDDLWVVSHERSKEGLFILRNNKTLDNSGDDIYKSFELPANDDDSRNVGQVLLIDNDGVEVTKNINVIVEDLNNHVWLGTDRGILVNYQPQLALQQDQPIFSRIKVPRNDGTDYADYLFESEVINTIEVDAANRKWVGTENIGAILVSSDGTKKIKEFNTENSPLPSNYIISITIDHKTGEVYFATDNGIVSYRGDAVEGQDTLANIVVYPNPVRPEYEGNITVSGLMDNSNVKITDTAGNLVFETVSRGGQIYWDGKNLFGNNVKTGVYLVFVASNDGSFSAVTKIAIIK